MESPPAPPRAAIRQPAPADASEIALIIVRTGVEHPVTGEQLRPNDRITLDRDAGLALMRGGAADLAPDEEEAAANAH